MFRLSVPTLTCLLPATIALALVPAQCQSQAHVKPQAKPAAQPPASWSFSVSGDSRNCGDFVMPVIAADVKAENDAFYWHLGDFRAISGFDQDMLAMLPAGTQLSKAEYQKRAWDDFLTHQMAAFGNFPVFLGRGNHETNEPMTRDGYISKFSSFLNRPEILAQRNADGPNAAPIGPWYHFIRDGVDFINLDNSSHEEFTDAQLHWLRALLDRDLAPRSTIHTIVAGMHEALPHSSSSNHAMDDWDIGLHTGELVYRWFYEAQTTGKHVYLLASHSHYYSPGIFDNQYWQDRKKVVPGWIIGTAGAHRYLLPQGAPAGSKTMIYGYMQGTVDPDGSIIFTLHEFTEADLMKWKWPQAPAEAVHECFVHNGDTPKN